MDWRIKIDKQRLVKFLLYGLWASVIGGFLFLLILFTYISFQDLPTFQELENPEYDFASIIYDENGTPFGKYYIENREPLEYNEVSPLVLNALISTEDSRFFSHSGIDLQALFRVAFKTVLLRKESSGGGSTISQQLAKLLFERPSLRGMGTIKRTFKLVEVKLKEWITAVKLEKSYTKEEIIAMYLNKFEFINGSFGLQAASQTYFNKDQSELKAEEAAVLVGMLQNPSLYNPLRFPEKSKERRNIVLNRLKSAGKLDKVTTDSLSATDIDMSAFNRKTQSEGPAPYFRSELTKWLRKLFIEKNIVKSDGTPYNIYTDGLKIYTTIDLNYQKYAEQAVSEHMKVNQERFFRVWKNRDPWTYDAEPEIKEVRKNMLERKIKGSERYLTLRARYLDGIINEIRKSDSDLPMSDNVIKALIDVKEKNSSLAAKIEENALDKQYTSAYNEILKDNKKWSSLIQAWNDLVAEYDKVFNEEIEMVVFKHDENGIDTVMMSPYDSVRYHNMHLQSGMLAVEPYTGYIKAWVGGIDHKFFKYDHVNSRRQVGSTIKPFVYSTAIALQGINPCQEFDDIQYTIVPGDANFDVDKEWSPANANGEFTGNKYNLFHGLLYSKNSITVRLVKEMGNVQVIRDLLRNVGIDVDYELPGNHVVVPNVPSICLGAVDLSLYEMTGAYTTFANNGMYTEPIFIKSITDKNGKVIYNGIPKRNLAINPVYNAVMVEMLKNNVSGRYGLGIKSPAGGKTGTTNDYADGWFMGITPNLVVGTWVGGDDKWIRFLTLNDGQGFVMARPIFQKFLQGIEGDSTTGYDYNKTFTKPPFDYYNLVDCERFKDLLPEEEQERIRARKKKKDEFDDEFGDEF
jgi:penicillin-binding protein 1A